MLGFLCETQGRPPDVRLGTCGAQSSGFALRLCFVALVILCWVFFLFFLLPLSPTLLVLLRILRGFRGPTALRWHFGLPWRRPMQAGVFFFALQFCSFVSVLFPCEGDCRVLAVLRPGVHRRSLTGVGEVNPY